MTTNSCSEKLRSTALLSTFVRFPDEAASENPWGCQSSVETTSKLNLQVIILTDAWHVFPCQKSFSESMLWQRKAETQTLWHKRCCCQQTALRSR